MNVSISEHTKKVLFKLAQIQRQIVGYGEILSEKILSPDDEKLSCFGFSWGHYVSEILMATGFSVYGAINADADYSFTVALGDKNSDLTPYFETNKPISELYNFKGRNKPLDRLRANLDLRLGQIGIGKPIDYGEVFEPLRKQIPFNFLWTELMIKQRFANGITALAGIDHSGHDVLVYLHADDSLKLNPIFVRNPALRKAKNLAACRTEKSALRAAFS